MSAYSLKDFKAFVKDGEVKLPFTLKLLSPVVMGEDLIESLTFKKEPTAEDIGDLPVNDQKMSDFFKPLGRITGETLVTIRRLSFKDLNAAMEVMNHFLSGSPEAGEEN